MNANLAAAYPLLIGDTTEPAELAPSLPPLIKRRWSQALRVNNRADWRQMAELCGQTAITIFCENAYDANHPDFRAACRLARVAHMRGVALMPKPPRMHNNFEACA